MGWALDLDGVIWLADQPIPGAVDAVEALRAAGEEVVFCTNLSSRPVGEAEQKLARIGIPAEGAVLTSAMAAAMLIEPGERVLVCAGPGVDEALLARGAVPVRQGPADAVVVGLHLDFDYGRLEAASTAVRGGARLIGTNGDPTYPTLDGLVPGGGAILAAVATASGVEPVVAGKPHPPMVELVRDRLGEDGTMVGDRMDTDGELARALGYRFVLVLSGSTSAAPSPADGGHVVPDLVADDLAAAVTALL
ncbi:MAG: HAD-IIA family hydrolase [Acidimicrobiales bacterium]|nr:HAD-IIA family hydrolase [Acidimicrobiales bacterium]